MTANSVRSDAEAFPVDEHPPPPRRRPAWLDWLDATDPGQMRLLMAAETVIATALVLGAEYIFVRGTGTLQVAIPAKAPAAVAAELWAVNHALLVVALMLGAMIALAGGFGGAMFTSARGQVLLALVLPLPLLATLAVGLSVHNRMALLALLAVSLAVGTYCRRFGPVGFLGGILGFIGLFLGFFVQAYLPLSDFGWLAVEVLIGTAVFIIVHSLLFRPRPETAMRRMKRSYAARARALASEVARLYEATTRSDDPQAVRREERRLGKQLLRLNETALLIDAQLNTPAAVPAGWSPAALHQLLFDAEVSLSNVARFALALGRRPLPGPASVQVEAALAGVRDADLIAVFDSAATIRQLLADGDQLSQVTPDDSILLHRFATSVTELGSAMRAFRLYPDGQAPDDMPDEGFTPQVATFGGYLPGSAFVAGAASQEKGGTGLIQRIRLAPYARTAIQVGIAAAAAIAAGDALSGKRFYWALLVTFITFMGANTAGEQLRKSLFRVTGMVVGVLAGGLLAHAVGPRVWLQILVVLVALFFGMYLSRINYMFLTIGITVMVSQLYVELDEFSNHLLVLRLGETAVGAGVTILTILLVLPLHIGRVTRVAARHEIEALADLTDRCIDRLADPDSATGSDLELRAAARRVDAAFQALAATVQPMRTPLFGNLATWVTGFMTTTSAARHYARNLLLDAATRYADLDAAGTERLRTARHQFADSVGAIAEALAPDPAPAAVAAAAAGDGGGVIDGAAAGGDGGAAPVRQYVRSASLFERVADGLPGEPITSRPQLALHDLQLLDGALAEAARVVGIPVTDMDTVRR